MKRLISTVFATVVLMGSLSNQAFAQTKPSLVTAFLDRLGMNYRIQKDGNFIIFAGVDGNRTQAGLISSEVKKFGDNEFVILLSFSQISEKPPNAEKIAQLQGSITDISEGLSTIFQEGKYVTYYYKIIPLKKNSDLARKDIIEILNIADIAEKELDGKDVL